MTASLTSAYREVFGGAYVSGTGAWPETCHSDWCVKGMWVSDEQVHGSWRSGGSAHWTSFSVSYASTVGPPHGHYTGSGRTFGEHRANGLCFQGAWQDDYYVVGSWRHQSDQVWNPFEARAYAS